jgi:hypothetical protein
MKEIIDEALVFISTLKKEEIELIYTILNWNEETKIGFLLAYKIFLEEKNSEDK